MTVTRTDVAGASDPAPDSGSSEGDEPAADLGLPGDAPQRAPIEIVLLALFAVAVGIVFRFVARTPLWLDEALTVNIASLSPTQINDQLHHDGHPPLYYYLLHYWMEAVGRSDLAVRALSGLVSVLTLPVAWLAGRRRGGPVLGWVMVAILSISSYAVRYATEARMYSLVMLLVMVGYLLVDDLIGRRRSSWWRLAGIGLVCGLLLLTHYWSMFLIAAVWLTVGWRWWHRRDRAELHVLIAMATGSILLFFPWLGVFRFQSAHTGTPWASPFRPTTTLAVTLQDFHTATSDFKDPILALALTSVLVVLGLFGVAVSTGRIELDLRTARQVRYESAVVGLTLAIGGLAGLVTRSAYASRYAAVVYPLFVLVVAAGVTRFVSRSVRFAVLVVYLALSSLAVVQVSLVHQRSQAGEAASAIVAKARPQDIVVYCPDQLGPAGQRALGDGLRQYAYPSLGDPGLVDWVDYADRNEHSDPNVVATRLLDLAGDDHSIFVVWAGSYKSLEGRCEELMHALSQKRPKIADLLTGDSEKFFEHENVKQFEPSSPS